MVQRRNTKKKEIYVINQTKTPAKQFFTFAIPATINMVLSSLIPMVDGLFIGRVIGEEGIAAVSLCHPIFMTLIATVLMFAVGGTVRTSHNLGAKKLKEANQNFNQCLWMIVVVLIILCGIIILFSDVLVDFIAQGKPIASMSKEYINVMKFFYPIMMINMTFSIFLRVQGKPQLPMFIGLFGNLVNVVLDFIFILIFKWGITGAAYASGISVIIPFIINISLYSSNKNILHFAKFKLDVTIVKDAILNGSSEFVGNISTSICIFIVNTLLLRNSGHYGVAAYSILSYILKLQGMIITGLTIGIGPLIGFYYGAKDKKQIFKIYSVAIKTGLVVGAVFWLFIVFFHTGLANVFAPGEERIMDMAKSFYIITALACLFNGINFLTSTCFTSMGKAKESFIIAILRSMVFYIVLSFILPRIFHGDCVWYFYPGAEILTVFFSIYLMRKYWKKG